MFIRRAKYNAMQNEILRLTHVSDAWEAQNESDLNEIRILQKRNAALHDEMTSILIDHEQLEADFKRQSEELVATQTQLTDLTIKYNRLNRAFNAAPHGGNHGN